jgi:hypothetical protein
VRPLPTQLQLVRAERLRPASVLRAPQLPDHQPQLVNLGIGSVALGAQAVALRSQPLEGAGPVFQQRHHHRQPSLQLGWILRLRSRA